MLNRGDTITLQRAADALDITRRHVRRLLKQLQAEGLEINERREGRVKHFTLDPASRTVNQTVDLQEQEVHALTVAALAAQSVLGRTPFENGLEMAVEKLLRATGPMMSFEPEWQDQVWHFDEGRTSNVDPEVFLEVVRAANRRETLSIDYFAASSQVRSENRPIDPLVVAQQGSTWLLAARCHRSQSVLDFALAGIRRVERTGEMFVSPSDFDPDTHFADRFHALKGDGDHCVVIEVAPDKAPYFDRKTYHRSQAILERHDDGRIRVAFEVSSLVDIAAFVRSWGDGVYVVEPEALASSIAREAQALAEAYDRRTSQ